MIVLTKSNGNYSQLLLERCFDEITTVKLSKFKLGKPHNQLRKHLNKNEEKCSSVQQFGWSSVKVSATEDNGLETKPRRNCIQSRFQSNIQLPKSKEVVKLGFG